MAFSSTPRHWDLFPISKASDRASVPFPASAPVWLGWKERVGGSRDKLAAKLPRQWEHTVTFKCHILYAFFFISFWPPFTTTPFLYASSFSSTMLLPTPLYNFYIRVSLSDSHISHAILLLRNTHTLSKAICMASHQARQWNNNKQAHTKPQCDTICLST